MPLHVVSSAATITESQTGSATSSVRQNPLPFITPIGVANVSTALVASASLVAIAVLIDIMGDLIFPLVEEDATNAGIDTHFSYILLLGSVAFGTVVLLVLAYSGMVACLLEENNQCTKMSVRIIIWLIFLMDMGFGFVRGHFFYQDHYVDLVNECFWPKLISLSIAVCLVTIITACGGDQYMVARLADFHAGTHNELNNRIGPSTYFHDAGGLRGIVKNHAKACCALFFSTQSVGCQFEGSDSQSALLSADDEEVAGLLPDASVVGITP